MIFFVNSQDPCDYMVETAHFRNISSDNGKYSFLWNSKVVNHIIMDAK
jgi:hypothetical protein